MFGNKSKQSMRLLQAFNSRCSNYEYYCDMWSSTWNVVDILFWSCKKSSMMIFFCSVRITSSFGWFSFWRSMYAWMDLCMLLAFIRTSVKKAIPFNWWRYPRSSGIYEGYCICNINNTLSGKSLISLWMFSKLAWHSSAILRSSCSISSSRFHWLPPISYIHTYHLMTHK